MNHSVRNQKGNSIVLVLGLMSVIGLGYNHVATSQNHTISTLIIEKSQRYHADSYKGLLESVLKNPEACAATFAGTTPSGSILQISTAPAVPMLTVGDTLGISRSNASRLVVETLEWAAVGGPGGHEINVTFVGTVDNFNRRYNRTINIVYTLVGAVIDTCSVAENATLTDACTAMGGVLVGSNCTNIQDPGSTAIAGSLSAENINITNLGTVTSGVVASPVVANVVQATMGFTASSFTGASITSSGSATASSMSSAVNLICAVSGCQSWILRQCAINQFMYAIASDGSIACANW